MRIFFLVLLFATLSMAVTPFSLENLKELNLTILNKKEIISKKLEERIKEKILSDLHNLGIQTKSEHYFNFLVSIKIDTIKEIPFVRTSILITEDVVSSRAKDLELLAITYKKEDSFEAENIEEDIYESIAVYLMDDFIEQYKDENEL